MPLEVEPIIVCFVTLFVASVVQSAIGFGMGLLAGPVLLWAGLGLPTTVTVIICATAVQCGFSAWRLRESIPWRPVAATLPLRVIGMAGGLSLMALLAIREPAVIRQYVGFVLLGAVIAQAISLLRGTLVERVPWPLSGAAFLASGLMAGFCAMGGPPLVLWVNAHRWPAARMRAFLLTSFALANPVQMGILLYRYGSDTASAMAIGAICIPGMLAGSILGLKLGKRIHADMLRILALIMLAILALSSIIAPWLS